MTDKRNIVVFLKYVNVLKSEKLPVGELECNKLELKFDELNDIIINLNDFTEFCAKSSVTKSISLTKLCELIVGFGTVGYVDGEEKEHHESDYPYTSLQAEKCFQYSDIILKHFEDLECSDKRKIIICLIILCATHNKKYAWSSKASISASSDFLKSLLTFTNHDSLTSLLCGDSFYPTIFKGVLKKLRPSLMKDTWLKFPSSCYIFSWILHHVVHPYLADYLNDIFPPPCMFISHHELRYQIVAIQCFQHILDIVPPTLIKLDGKEDVIYSLLSPYMHSTEEDLIAVVPSCLLKLPSMKFQKMSQIGWSLYDEVLNRLLIRTEMERKTIVRHLYLSHIHSYIQIVPPFKHLKCLWKVIEDSITKDEDIICQKMIFLILRDVLKLCWPRMKYYCFRILKCLCISLSDLEDRKYQDYDEKKKELLELCKECLHLLKLSCKDEFQEILSKYVEADDDMPGVELFKTILQDESMNEFNNIEFN